MGAKNDKALASGHKSSLKRGGRCNYKRHQDPSGYSTGAYDVADWAVDREMGRWDHLEYMQGIHECGMKIGLWDHILNNCW